MRSKLISNLVLGMIVLLQLAAPFMASAAYTPPRLWPTGYWGRPLISCSGAGGGGLSACTSLCDLIYTAINLIYFGITLVLFVFTPILVAWGGIMIMIAGGSPQKVQSGRKIITGTLWGVLISLGAFVLVRTLLLAVGANVSFGDVQCTP